MRWKRSRASRAVPGGVGLGHGLSLRRVAGAVALDREYEAAGVVRMFGRVVDPVADVPLLRSQLQATPLEGVANVDLERVKGRLSSTFVAEVRAARPTYCRYWAGVSHLRLGAFGVHVLEERRRRA